MQITDMLVKLLPKDKRAMARLIMQIASRLDTPQERRDVAEWGIQNFSGGKITVGSWAELGGKLGILTGPNNGSPRKTPRVPPKAQLGSITTVADN